TDARHVDLLDPRRVHRERALDKHLVERLLTDGERLTDARPLPLDADALEHLDAAAVALDHLEMHADGVAGLELGHLSALAVLDVLDHCHGKPVLVVGSRPMVPAHYWESVSPTARVSAPGATVRCPRGGRKATPPAPSSRGTPRAACSAGTRGRPRAPPRTTR